MKLLGYGVPREMPVWLVDEREIERFAGLDHRKVWIWGYGLPLAVSLIGPWLGYFLGIADRAYYDALIFFPALASPLIAVFYVRAWKRFFVGCAYVLAIAVCEAIALTQVSASMAQAWVDYVDLKSTAWLLLTFFIGETILLSQARLAYLNRNAVSE